MWSFVRQKAHQHWLWHALDHARCITLAYAFGSHEDTAFITLKEHLAAFGIQKFYTGDWEAYTRHLSEQTREVGKANTQKIECKRVTLRTRIKRLARKTL
jgi:insertion element IS1 protein InsB